MTVHNRTIMLLGPSGKITLQVNVQTLRETFARCGEIVELKIPTKPDGATVYTLLLGLSSACMLPGTKRGFGFVQFARKIDAAKAIKQLNEEKMFDRPIAVDWALSQVTVCFHWRVLD